MISLRSPSTFHACASAALKLCLLAAALLSPRSEAAYTVSTLIGLPPGSADGVGSAARFDLPNGVAADAAGNVYVADSANGTIRKITPGGVVTTLAGTAGVLGSADGTGPAARFNYPQGVAVDGAGNVYVADQINSTIRKITPAGVVTTLAGSPGVAGGADGTGPAARFNEPEGLAVDGVGNVYVADQLNAAIRKITPAGVVTTVAGALTVAGSSDGTGAAARFNYPADVAVDGAGNLYVADELNSTIRKITPAGVVTTIAGTPSQYGSADGTGGAARFHFPNGVALDGAGNLYVTDTANDTLRKVTPAGVVTTVAGTPGLYGVADGTGAAGLLNQPLGVTVTSTGLIFLADTSGTIRTVTPGGAVTTFAGLASDGSVDGPGAVARLNQPQSVRFDSAGNLLIADQQNDTIRRMTPADVVSTLAGAPGVAGSNDGPVASARFFYISDMAPDPAGNLYIVDENNNTIRKLTPGGLVSTVAGQVGVAGAANGTGSAAQFNDPESDGADSQGNIYVADCGNSVIRKITPGGLVTTFAGLADVPGAADGLGAAARFNYPEGLVVDTADNIYVADTASHTIRKITPAGLVTTLAGTAGLFGNVDGTGPAARFNAPQGITVDAAGNVFVADTFNSTIRKVTPAGVVTTIAGVPGKPGSADGPGATAQFNFPSGIAVDSAGNLYIGDELNSTVRLVSPLPPPAVTTAPVSQTVRAGTSATFTVAASGSALTYQWYFNGAAVSGATSATYTVASANAANAGSYTVTVANPQGTVTSSGAVLAVAAVGAPVLAAQPQAQTMSAGSILALAVSAPGTAATYQWYLNGVALSGATRPTLVISNVSAAAAGSYACLVANAAGSALSQAAAVTVTASASPGRLVNLSVLQAVSGSLALGYVVGGAGTSGSENLLIRATGPTLALPPFNVAGVLADPTLAVVRQTDSVTVAANAGWGAPASNQAAVTAADAAVGAFALANPASLDSALVALLPVSPGGYSAIVKGQSGDSGTALAEVYDATPAGTYGATTPRLVNLSCLTRIAAGGTLTVGFVIGGSASETVLIRVSGPSLAAAPFGMSGTMADPQLAVQPLNSPGTILAQNSGWGGDAQVAAAALSVGAFALASPASNDSAVVVTLAAGVPYTVEANSASGGAGTVLVEIYELP